MIRRWLIVQILFDPNLRFEQIWFWLFFTSFINILVSRQATTQEVASEEWLSTKLTPMNASYIWLFSMNNEKPEGSTPMIEQGKNDGNLNKHLFAFNTRDSLNSVIKPGLTWVRCKALANKLLIDVIVCILLQFCIFKCDWFLQKTGLGFAEPLALEGTPKKNTFWRNSPSSNLFF